MPAFQSPRHLEDGEAEIVGALLGSLEGIFEGTGVVFTTDAPATTELYSTIYLGGDGAAFSEFGSFIGLAEQVDVGNRDRSDTAFIFTDAITPAQTATDYGRQLGGYVAHEAGHLLGYAHASGDVNDGVGSTSILSEVAFSPFTHIGITEDVRADLIEDGRVVVAGQAYDVDPRIVEAISKYPAYYDAGSVGPDGFPDLTMGQLAVHPDSTGIWIGHVPVESRC